MYCFVDHLSGKASFASGAGPRQQKRIAVQLPGPHAAIVTTQSHRLLEEATVAIGYSSAIAKDCIISEHGHGSTSDSIIVHRSLPAAAFATARTVQRIRTAQPPPPAPSSTSTGTTTRRSLPGEVNTRY
jgi:hypothetical protein